MILQNLLQIIKGINVNVAFEDFEVQVGPRGSAGGAFRTNPITPIDRLTHNYVDSGHMSVQGAVTITMVDGHPVAVTAVIHPPGHNNPAGVGRQHRCAIGGGDIDAGMVPREALGN